MSNNIIHVKHRTLLVILCLVMNVYGCNVTEKNEVLSTDRNVFINVTREAGIDRFRDSYAHCWGDINGDGYPDIFVINHIAVPVLFRNNGDGTFTDITSYSGLKKVGDLHGCAIADYDNDGDQDIYVSVGAGRGKGTGLNRLYQNDGKGVFGDVAIEAGVADPKGRGRSVSWIDYNNDGFLDLFLANDKRNDAPSVLFKNMGNGTFTVESGLKIVENVMAAGWIDYDNDGFMDLIISIYKKHMNGEIRIYKNAGDGTFLKTYSFDGRSFVWADYDNDGAMDLLISNPPRVHIGHYEFDILSKLFKGFIKLYKNTGDGRFTDVSDTAGFGGEMGGEQAVFFDYDNDGYQDMYLVIGGSKRKNINDQIFRNLEGTSFSNVTKSIGLNQDFSGRGCGIAFCDYDGDGFLDLFLTNGKLWEPYVSGKDTGPYVLYKNAGNAHHWLDIKLIGTKSNRDGIGARIKLIIGHQIQYRQNLGGMEGYIQNCNAMHFGLGNAAVADTIEVVWPSGNISEVKNIEAGHITIQEHVTKGNGITF